MKITDTRFKERVFIRTSQSKKIDVLHRTITPNQVLCLYEGTSMYFSVESVEEIVSANSVDDIDVLTEITDTQKHGVNKKCMICNQKADDKDEEILAVEYTDTRYKMNLHPKCLFDTADKLQTVLDDRSEEVFVNVI